MSSSVATYQHTSLSSEDSIRVFDLLPSICPKAPVEVRMREVSLSCLRTKYEVLSYVPGDAKSGGISAVLCAGKTLPVTDNCHAALVHLRRCLWTRTLWVDAICIDQVEDEAGTKERNRQVQQVGRIYNRAWRAIIWLGQGDKNMKLLFRAIRLWSLSAKAEKLFNRNDSIAIEIAILAATLLLFRVYPGRDCVQPGLSDLSRNPWFLRVWTVQEVALARTATIMTSCSKMSWNTFTAVSHGIELGYSRTPMRSFLDSVFVRRHTAAEAADISTTTLTGSEMAKSFTTSTETVTEDKRRLLRCLPYFQCARGHDKVYGIHAMASDWGYKPTRARLRQAGRERVPGIRRGVFPPTWEPNAVDDDTTRRAIHRLTFLVTRLAQVTPCRVGRGRGRLGSMPSVDPVPERVRDRPIHADPPGHARQQPPEMVSDGATRPLHAVGPARSRQLGPIFPTSDEPSWEFSWDRVARHKVLLDWLHRTRYASLDEAIAALGDSPFVDVLSNSQKLDNNPNGEVPQYLQHVSRSPAVLESNYAMMQRRVNLFANYAFLTLDDGLWARAHLSCQVGRRSVVAGWVGRPGGAKEAWRHRPVSSRGPRLC
ncbi:hypothetical protein PG994_000006 [Apiospora phragmitis]|uniref:Heterokaryon incompatibility domain-containing protein n=1 Tax=Apiospora phragmitis TaxID=2905665 RepID=A0ABR1X501_9PEZI